MTPSDERYLSGVLLGQKYRLIQQLGSGGVGAVWVARNTVLEVDVAVKLLRLEVAAPEAAERLLQEARAAARLTHPSIVRIFDFGTTKLGDPFIVMELLRGESLGDALGRKERLPATVAVRTLLPVVSALVEAHGKGIIHRDLKPDNVFLARDEAGAVMPKVVDFGIAKLSGAGISATTTKVGEVVGSPAYLSPEQARGATIDARSDVWSMAVMLYEVIAGRPPFKGDTYEALLASILIDDPVPLEGEQSLFARIARALAKDPNGRYASMKDFGQALARWALDNGITTDLAGTELASHWFESSEGRGLSEPPSSSLAGVQSPLTRSRRGRWVAVTIGFAIALGCVAFIAVRLSGDAPAPANAASPPPPSAALPSAAPPASAALPSAAPPASAEPAPSPPALSATAATGPAPSARSLRKAPEPHRPPGKDMPVPAQPNF